MSKITSDALDLGIYTIDTGYIRPGFDASHLIIENGRAAFVDVGTSYSVPRLLKGLADLGLSPDSVDYIILTHIHLDHAGGAGELIKRLPNARLTVHPRGAKHMIDPGKLIAGATAVYGDARMEALYGAITAVDAERVIETPDGFELDLNGRPLKFLDTPGHARHHVCIVDEKSRGIFTGDTFGLAYKELDTDSGAFVFPSTSPTQLDPDALIQSIERLLTYQPQRMYLTHYGAVENVAHCAQGLLKRVRAFADLARDVPIAAPDRHRQLVVGQWEILLGDLNDHGCTLAENEIRALLELDVEINAQGLAIWRDRLE
ncbi:MAG: MBL fold metallo-hydrolase [Gammaproteobacteria bacterium]|nr:MBL fold metallo-hydrolase [Gammaproteobacteria bacterium]